MAPHDRTQAVAEPLAPWFGGKKHLAKRIIERIDAIPHRCYAEPFVGMGGVFLRRAGVLKLSTPAADNQPQATT